MQIYVVLGRDVLFKALQGGMTSLIPRDKYQSFQVQQSTVVSQLAIGNRQSLVALVQVIRPTLACSLS